MKIFRYSNWFFILVLVAVSLYATKSLWHSGLFTSHDGPHQAVRLFYYLQSLKDGQFPPRYILPAFQGFGYPLFIFSYHLPWLVSVPLNLIGFSIYDCIKILFIITFVISGLTMYWWQKKLWHSNWAAFIGAFLYLWAPYRFLDIYVRGSLGEAMTFMFLPLALYSFFPSKEKSSKKTFSQIVTSAVGIAGLILSHSLIFVLFFPVLVLSVLSHPPALAFGKSRWRAGLSYLKKAFTGFFLGLGLSAFYLLPAVFLKGETVFDKEMAGTASTFVEHFPAFKQLLYSPWGYGFSFPGAAQDAMSFQVGIAQWIVVGLAIVIMVLYVIARTPIYRRPKQSQAQGLLHSLRSLAMTKLNLGLFFLFAFALSIFMLQPLSKPVWQWVNRFAYIDYPWRYLFLSVFSVSVLGGFCVASFKSLKLPKLPACNALRSMAGRLKLLRPEVLLGLFLIIVALYTNRNHIRVNAWLDWPVQAFVGEGDTSNSFDEYAPKTANESYFQPKKALLEIFKGNAKVSKIVKKTNKVSFRTENKEDSLFRVNLWYFPRVLVLVDGQKIEYTYKDKGVLDFWVGKGEHQVEVKFVRTGLEKIALIISGFSLVYLIFLAKKFKIFS